MAKVLLRTEDWVYLYSEIASVMQQKFFRDQIWEVHEDEDGIFHDVRTPKSEENFCELCGDVEEIMCNVLEKAQL